MPFWLYIAKTIRLSQLIGEMPWEPIQVGLVMYIIFIIFISLFEMRLRALFLSAYYAIATYWTTCSSRSSSSISANGYCRLRRRSPTYCHSYCCCNIHTMAAAVDVARWNASQPERLIVASDGSGIIISYCRLAWRSNAITKPRLSRRVLWTELTARSASKYHRRSGVTAARQMRQAPRVDGKKLPKISGEHINLKYHILSKRVEKSAVVMLGLVRYDFRFFFLST